MMAGFGPALARAVACGGKMFYKLNILSMEMCTISTV